MIEEVSYFDTSLYTPAKDEAEAGAQDLHGTETEYSNGDGNLRSRTRCRIRKKQRIPTKDLPVITSAINCLEKN